MAEHSFSKLLAKYDGTKKYAGSVEKAELIIGTVSQVYGYYKLADEIGRELGLWGGGLNQSELLLQAITDLWKAIDENFEDLNLELKSEFEGVRQMLLDQSLFDLRGAVMALSQQWGDMNLDYLLEKTSGPTLLLTYGSQWERTFYKEAVYQDRWTGPVVPPELEEKYGEDIPPGVKQWDYVMALPAFLEGLSRRVIVVRLLDAKDIPTDYRGELEGYIKQLHDIYKKIANEICTLRKPTRDEVMFQQSPVVYPPAGQPAPEGGGTIMLSLPRWEESSDSASVTPGGLYGSQYGGLYGAFDVRLLVASVEEYPTQPPRPWWPGADPNEMWWRGSRGTEDQVAELRVAVDAWYDKEIEGLHGLRSLRHWKQVYGALSLRSVWDMRNDLLVLLGERPEVPPGQTDLWSLRDAVDAIPAEIRPRYSLRAITDLCNTEHSLAALQRV